MQFRFLNPGPLIDHDLELVAPDVRWVDAILHACNHPGNHSDNHAASRGDERGGRITRTQLMDLLKVAPGGHQPADPGTGRVPAYHFWMRLHPVEAPPFPTWGPGVPPIGIAGTIGLRIASNPEVELYFGHVGYAVFPLARGNHYAERATRLLLPLARAHGLTALWITCNPDNWASRRTCERLGGTMVEIVNLPRSNILYQRGERQKCRYRVELSDHQG